MSRDHRSTRVVECSGCGDQKFHFARGMCRSCHWDLVESSDLGLKEREKFRSRRRRGIVSDAQAGRRLKRRVYKSIMVRQGRSIEFLSAVASYVSGLDSTPTLEQLKTDLGFYEQRVAKNFGTYGSFLRALGVRPNVPGARASRCLDMCEQILGRELDREVTFDWLRAPDTGCKLRVDAFFEDLDLVIEYDDESHFNPRYFERFKNGSFTRRKLLDAVRDKQIPAHGMTLVRVPYWVPLEKANLREALGEKLCLLG